MLLTPNTTRALTDLLARGSVDAVIGSRRLFKRPQLRREVARLGPGAVALGGTPTASVRPSHRPVPPADDPAPEPALLSKRAEPLPGFIAHNGPPGTRKPKFCPVATTFTAKEERVGVRLAGRVPLIKELDLSGRCAD